MPQPGRQRRIFSNRTLNMRSIKAVGYDMDYTLVHYYEDRWEQTAYRHAKSHLQDLGWPVGSLVFDPKRMIRGLIIDTELGNIVKANRFGFVKRAFHGASPLPFEQTKQAYARTTVDLSKARWRFMNTLFSLSEAVLYAQTVELFDKNQIRDVATYRKLYLAVRNALDEVHMMGKLKQEIGASPEAFVDLDKDMVLSLLDQKHADKKLLLITNSEWSYTRDILHFAFDRELQGGQTWRDLFDLAIVEARKPSFFTARNPAFQVVDEKEGLLKPAIGGLQTGCAYVGGDADQVEKCLEVSGDEILYVGDHIFSDVNVSKSIQRWRTALIIRELEAEILATEKFAAQQTALESLMEEKSRLELEHCRIRIDQQRVSAGYGPQADESQRTTAALREELSRLDEKIGPLAQASGELGSKSWGLLLRAGNDKSHLARQIERYADIYTSRASNFTIETPFAYLRSARGSLPHDP